MANDDRAADVYFRRIDATEAQDACRGRVHWLCRQAEGRRVLDIGCTQGISAVILAREGHEVVSIDIEARPLEAARELLAGEPPQVQERTRFVPGDAFSVDFEPNSFDTIIMGAVLEHLASPDRLLERVSEWLAEGGRVVVSVTHGYDPGHDHKHSFYVGSLLELLSKRFSVVEVDVVARRFLCAVALKPPAGQAPQLPDVARLLRWERRSYANIGDAERRQHADRLARQRECEKLERRATEYRQVIGNLNKAGAELRQEARSAQAALQQEQSARSSLAKESDELRRLWKEATQREGQLSRRLDSARQGEKRLRQDLQRQRQELENAQANCKREQQRRRAAESRVQRLTSQEDYYKATLALREEEVRYQLGDALVRAARPSLDTLRLPFRIARLFLTGLGRCRQRRRETKKRELRATATSAPATSRPAEPPPSRGKRPEGSGSTIAGAARKEGGVERHATRGDREAPQLTDLNEISTLAEPYSTTPPELCRRDDLCIAAVTDEFSWRAWQYEAELYTFTPKTWREALEARKPDLLLIESAWSGLNDSWYFQIRDLGKRGEVIKYYAIPDIVAWCRQHGVPTVFYNKEDPPNFDVFIDAAKQFDYVFTSDANCIVDYRKHVGHERVFALPFAAQPRIHNPIMTGTRTGSVCFAGTWYAHRHFARHDDAHKILRPALDFDLHIFDRMANSENPNYRWPDDYLTAVRGALPYSQMLAAYKRYKVFLNINSVKNSPTMFARRVFELLACGTPVISSYSEGIEQLLGPDVVLMSDDEKTTRELLERVLGDDEYRERLALSGQRKVFGEHTYMHRVSYVLESIGLKDGFDARPRMTCVCPVEDTDDIVAAQKLYQRQRYERRALILCANDAAVAERAANAVRDVPNARVVCLEDAAWGHVIKQAVHSAVEGRVALMNPRDFYGPFYLTDYAHTTYYVDQEPIGKAHYHASDGGATPSRSGKPLVYRYVSEIYPWTLCLSRADALARAAALVGARSPWEWCNRAMRATERFYSPDCFSYVRCEEVTPTSRTPVAVSRAAASRSEALTAISA